MAFVVNETTGGDFLPLPPGDYLAHCVGVFYLGLQRNDLDPTKPPKGKLALDFEVLDEFRDDGKPYRMMAFFTMSLHKQSTLRPFLEAWRGKPFDPATLATFDVSKLAGVPAKLIVSHKISQAGKTRAVINMAIPVKTEVKAKLSPPIAVPLLFDADAPDQSVLAQLPEFLKKIIASAEEPAPMIAEPANSGVPFDDDLSF